MTLAQVVESSYGWANGDVPPGTWLDDDVCGPQPGDGLFDFLWRELVVGSAASLVEVNTPEHWATARARAAQVLREVQSVAQALAQYGPEEEAV